MTNAKRDQNYVPALLGVSLVDLTTPSPLVVDPVTGRLLVNASTTIDTTGLATDTIQTNGTQKTQIVDAGGEVATITGGKLDVNASVDTTGLALDATLTGGTQKSQIVDAGGEAVTVTGGKLDVNASIDTTGLATSAKQDTGNTSLDNIDDKIPALGQALAANSVPVILPSATITTLTPPAAITGFATSAKQLADNHQVTVSNIANTPVITGFATSAKQDTLLTELQAKADLTETQPVELRLTGSDVTAKDDTFYGDGITTGIPSIAIRAYNGSDYDRIGSTSNALDVNIKSGGAGDGSILDGVDNAIKATVKDLTNSNPIATAIVDADGTQITSFGGGVQYTEGDIDASITGTAMMHEVAANTLATVSATNPIPISDNGGTLTVDGTVAVTNAGITTIAGAVAGTEMQVDVLTMPTTIVNNPTATNLKAEVIGTGTFVTQSTLAAETTKVIGTVNLNKVMGEDLLIGNGVTGAGSPRVTIASNNTPFAVKTDLTTPGTTNKVTLGADVVHTIIDSGTTIVTQATAANLNMTEASASAIKTAVEALDNSVDGNYLNVNMNIAGTDVAGGAGTVSAQTQRVTHASDDPVTTAVQLIDNAVSGAGFNITQMNGVNLLMGAGNTGTGSQRVTIATDQVAIASKAAINTYVDGSIVTLGAKADAKSTATDTTAVTLMQVEKQISASVQTIPSNVAHDSADSGNPLKVGGRASTTPVTAVAANDRVDAFFDVQGRQVVTAKALTGTASNVNASASNVTVLAANTARLGATFYNDSTAICYLKLGATASTTSFAVKMQPDAYYEVPFGYYGIVDGIWASATGVMRVTEMT